MKDGVSVFISSVGQRFRSKFFDEGFEFIKFAVASDQEKFFYVFRGWRWYGRVGHCCLSVVWSFEDKIKVPSSETKWR